TPLEGGACRLGGIMSADRAPADLAFDVYVRTNGRDWRIGSVSFAAGERDHSFIADTVAQMSWLSAERVDVVLRPSLDVAVRTVDRSVIWGEEVTLPNVPVEWPAGSNLPSTAPAVAPPGSHSE